VRETVTPRTYIDVNIPRTWDKYLNELLQNKEIQAQLDLAKASQKLSGLGAWIIEQFLIEHTSYRFEHINTLDNHITIKDRKLGRVVYVYIKEPKELWCELDNATECAHIQFSYTIPQVREVLTSKGWQLPDI
jgi:hypothetical protein